MVVALSVPTAFAYVLNKVVVGHVSNNLPVTGFVIT